MRSSLCVFLLALSYCAHAASFDCLKAKSAQEKAICASPELSAADDRMAAQYREILRTASPEAATEIREDQLDWLRRMPDDCPAEDHVRLSACLLANEQNRTKMLKHMVANTGGITFIWRSVSFAVPDDSDSPRQMQEDGRAVGKLDASWPQAISKAPEWIAWNSAIETAARNLASRHPSPTWQRDWAQNSDIDISVALGAVTDRLVTTTVSGEWYVHGAAYPNIRSIQFNWLLKAEREIRPLDVFSSGSGWDIVLDQTCDRDLNIEDATGHMQKVLHDIVINPENWQIDKDGIKVIYQTQVFGGHASPPEPTEISWSELKPYLNPNFPNLVR